MIMREPSEERFIRYQDNAWKEGWLNDFNMIVGEEFSHFLSWCISSGIKPSIEYYLSRIETVLCDDIDIYDVNEFTVACHVGDLARVRKMLEGNWDAMSKEDVVRSLQSAINIAKKHKDRELISLLEDYKKD